ncbi:MAG TPA: type II 3-dehydroquinate dehydratase, partial [Acidimicrobiales bacterium]|nr:type II 3-dehydroquinate dehydratase [Acidimicrobiales bacterium]
MTEPDRALVLLLSGPNLNLLGEREPSIYGTASLADHVRNASETAGAHGLTVEHHQSNHEGDLVELVHKARGRAAAIVINPGARESWRRTSVIAPVATGTI